jgi:Protein of unknown function (DUF1553)/Protein of unknown function (DUF1549)/Planctomycete cytochrome C
MNRHRALSRYIAVVLPLLVTFQAHARGGGPVEFNRDIRPILSENCYLCHGPDKTDRKADLRLDLREVALAKGAIVPAKVEESELVARILSDDPEEVMPPPKSTKKLTAAQKELLKRWVAEGARYQAHWAYEPIRRPAIPAVNRPNRIKNPIDAFILASLEARGLKPSAEADRRTLIRRLSLDLIGLPPTPEEVRTFESDLSPGAYEKAVDRLLASPHFGERMAVPWLDLVRFADTVGYHGDQNQDCFPYRDYVINAFNNNKPFDRFTIEQLAGDLLPDPTPDQLVATGFNRLNMMTREGGAQPREYLAKYAGDRVRTVAIAWLGSTMGCAECHDHKFDPFQARDFYRMAAFFADVRQWGVYSDYGYTPNPDLKGFTNDYPFPPMIEVESPYLIRRIAKINGRIREALIEGVGRISSDPSRSEKFEEWVTSVRKVIGRPEPGWLTPPAIIDPAPGEEDGSVLQPDGSLLLTGKVKPKETTTIRLEPGPGWVASIRLELLPHPDHKGRIIRGNAGPTVSLAARSTNKTPPLQVFLADADAKEERYANGFAIPGIIGGWKLPAMDLESRRSAVYQLKTPIHLGEGDRLIVSLRGDGLGRVRLSVSPMVFEDLRRPVVEAPMVDALTAEAGSRTPEQSDRLKAAYLVGTGSDTSAIAEYHRLAMERLECRDGKAMSMITRVREPMPTRVLPRGNWQDETGEVVSPGVPKFLPQPPEAESRRLNRLDLSRWLTSAENPLTARVFANRLWKQFFGNGLSAVMEDVGAQGEWPSHLELLDWLASDFREGGWDVKRLVKTMVMSATYRQDARLRPELREVDPSNRWLASQSPRRLEAEFVRDNALAIAGLLNPDLGGPSVKPYQPPGYYAILQFPDRDYLPQLDDRQYRRGVYTHWQRTFLHPMLANFDAPSREECTASRTVANTPQQALTLLNDPTFVEAARALAGSTLAAKDLTDEARLDLLFERALARKPKEKEAKSLGAFLADRRRECRDHPDEARRLDRVGIAPIPPGVDEAELSSWTEVARVILNLHETITRY